jgi:hypothetical protein
MTKKEKDTMKKSKQLKGEIKKAIDKKRASGTPSKDSKKIEKPTVKRDEKGRLEKGSVLNPKGKEKGTKHMTTLLKEALKRVAGDSEDPNDVAIVNSLISSAKAGNISAIEMVFNRIDGKQGALTGELPEDERISEVVIKFD